MNTASKQTDVSIIFVNYFTADLVSDAIKSVQDKSSGFTYECIVVDNSCSQDEYVKLQKLLSPSCQIIDAGDNLGFGKANNLGSSHAKGKYLFFLNGDTLLRNNAILELISFMDTHPDAIACGPNLFTKEGAPNNSFVKEEKNLRNEKKENSLLRVFRRKAFGRKERFNTSGKPMKIEGYIHGAALMMRKKDFDKVGGFSKKIFMYAEECLLCYQTRKLLGGKLYNVPAAEITHFEGGSFDGITPRRQRMVTDGNYIYYEEAFGPGSGAKYLKLFIRIGKRNARIYRVFGKKKQAEQYRLVALTAEEKLKEIQSND